jgi:hypothetical protein
VSYDGGSSRDALLGYRTKIDGSVRRNPSSSGQIDCVCECVGSERAETKNESRPRRKKSVENGSREQRRD